MNETANEMIADRHFVCNTSSAALFVADRNGNLAQAVRVTNGKNYYRAPTAVYFAGDFSFTGWFKINGFVSYQRQENLNEILLVEILLVERRFGKRSYHYQVTNNLNKK